MYDRLNLIPCAAGQTAADSRHVDRSSAGPGLVGDKAQALPNGIISDRRSPEIAVQPMLTNDVGNHDVRIDFNKLNFSEDPAPATEGGFRFGPTP